MGEAGVLGFGVGGEAVGWRATRSSSSSSMGSATNWITGGGDGDGRIVGGMGILQLLSPHQSNLVPILGKRTGWDETFCKRDECAGLENDWVTITGSNGEYPFEILPKCASYLQVKLRRVTDGGDHDVAICEVVGTGVWDDGLQSVVWLDNNVGSDSDNNNNPSTAPLDPSSVLYTGQLREEGII
mmetsp:Transcript_8495/g.15362  ORF Transcript_8495/g.15362 Transcript_8495/m.15362 type:complete len:185 (-) Transcript_8495:140-694(-)